MESTLAQQIDRLLQTPKEEDNTNTHHSRIHLEPWVLQTLRDRYLPTLRSWWSTYTLPDPTTTTTTKAIIIYETRTDPMLEFLVYNLCYFARSWRLHIFCSSQNLDYVNRILGHNVTKARVEVIRPETSNYTNERNLYNQTLQSRPFWESLQQAGYTHVLMAELDSYLRRPIDGIVGIEEYDYIAAQWEWDKEAPGGGGLSIRRVAKMLELCDTQPPVGAQDCWVSTGIKEVGGIVPKQFIFAESSLIKDAYGVHQWWSFIYPYQRTMALPIYEEYMTLEIEETNEVTQPI